MEAISQLAALTGMAMSTTMTQHSDKQIDEVNESGFIGKYMGCNVVALTNAFEADGVTPILKTNWLYIIPGGMTGDTRNLKIVNEGTLCLLMRRILTTLCTKCGLRSSSARRS